MQSYHCNLVSRARDPSTRMNEVVINGMRKDTSPRLFLVFHIKISAQKLTTIAGIVAGNRAPTHKITTTSASLSLRSKLPTSWIFLLLNSRNAQPFDFPVVLLVKILMSDTPPSKQ